MLVGERDIKTLEGVRKGLWEGVVKNMVCARVCCCCWTFGGGGGCGGMLVNTQSSASLTVQTI